MEWTTTQAASLGRRLVDTVGLSASPVAVRLLGSVAQLPPSARRLDRHRYCQALMLARQGEEVWLDAEGIACPAAAAAFGFRPLSAGLESGKGLVGYGIVSDPAVGRAMFAGMTRLEPGAVQALHLCPLERAECEPDVVVVEDQVERLMWIALANLHVHGGQRVVGSTAILQATCVDSTVIPYLEHRLNLGYGCYGCRDATDLGAGEAALGFPASDLPGMVEHLEYLALRAIPTSRAKGALAALSPNA